MATLDGFFNFFVPTPHNPHDPSYYYPMTHLSDADRLKQPIATPLHGHNDAARDFSPFISDDDSASSRHSMDPRARIPQPGYFDPRPAYTRFPSQHIDIHPPSQYSDPSPPDSDWSFAHGHPDDADLPMIQDSSPPRRLPPRARLSNLLERLQPHSPHRPSARAVGPRRIPSIGQLGLHRFDEAFASSIKKRGPGYSDRHKGRQPTPLPSSSRTPSNGSLREASLRNQTDYTYDHPRDDSPWQPGGEVEQSLPHFRIQRDLDASDAANGKPLRKKTFDGDTPVHPWRNASEHRLVHEPVFDTLLPMGPPYHHLPAFQPYQHHYGGSYRHAADAAYQQHYISPPALPSPRPLQQPAGESDRQVNNAAIPPLAFPRNNVLPRHSENTNARDTENRVPPSVIPKLTHAGTSFKITHLIGTGSTGRVFRAVRGGDVFAIKAIHTGIALRGHFNRSCFVREKEVMVAINSLEGADRYLATLQMSWENPDAGMIYFVMPFYPIDLFHALQLESPMTWRDRYLYCQELICALCVCRELGIVHLDIKPGNIAIDSKGRAVLIDFGMAKSAPLAEYETWRSTSRVGTYCYMAPEITTIELRDKEKGFRTNADVWSMGLVFMEILGFCKGPYFAARTQPDIIKEHSERLPINLSGFGHVEPTVLSMLYRMLQVNPDERIFVERLNRDYRQSPHWNRILNGSDAPDSCRLTDSTKEIRHDWIPTPLYLFKLSASECAAFLAFQDVHDRHPYYGHVNPAEFEYRRPGTLT